MSDRDNLIRERAFDLWERAGSPHHRSDEFWTQAEAEIQKEQAQQKAETKSVTKEAGVEKSPTKTVQPKHGASESKSEAPKSTSPSPNAKPDKPATAKPTASKAAPVVKSAAKPVAPRKKEIAIWGQPWGRRPANPADEPSGVGNASAEGRATVIPGSTAAGGVITPLPPC